MLRTSLRSLPRQAWRQPVALPLLRCNSSAPNPVDSAAAAAPQPTSREIIAQKSKDFESKYADALKRKMEAEGLQNLEELKEKAAAAEAEAKAAAQAKRQASSPAGSEASIKGSYVPSKAPSSSSSPITPLSSMLNLPALLSTPHPFAILSQVWETLHASLALSNPSRFLSATIPAPIYSSMVAVAKKTPQMILPLPREGGEEFFFLQWQFYDDDQSTVVFTSLGEYKLKGEWARPFLSVTHWTDLAAAQGETADLQGAVFMRAEITSTTPPKLPPSVKNASALNSEGEAKERFLLKPADAQLLMLGLQRFYNLESGDASDREARRDLLERFGKGAWDEKDWNGLSKLAVGKLKGIL